MSSSKLLAKSTAAELEKKQEEDGVDLAKSFDEVMLGLDAFIKSSIPSTDKKEALDEATIMKSIQDEAALKEQDARARREADEQKADEFAKSLRDNGDEGGTELDGEKVFADLKVALAKMLAKAIVSIREDMAAQFTQARDTQVLIAKSLSVNGKILKEAMHEVAVIGDQGRPRKSALSVFDKSMSGNGGNGNADSPQLDVGRVMKKALSLNEQKKISPNDVGVINHYVTGGHGIPSQFAHLFQESDVTQ